MAGVERSHGALSGAATLARDSFAGPPGTFLTERSPEVGGRGWKYEVGAANLVVGSGRLRCEATTERIATIAAPTTPNYRVDFDVWPASLLAADDAGVVGRYVGPNDWYGARYDRTSGQWQLLKKTTAGALVVLGTYPQALSAGVLTNAALIMEADRIRLETANLGETFGERVAVTDTALTGAGEAGVRFLPGTAHTASVGLHLEGVRVSEKRPVDTTRISSGTGRIAPGQDYVVGGPRIARPPPARRGVICGSGANQPPFGTYEFVRDFAEAGFTAVTGDYWDVPGVGWGNTSAVARWRTAWDYLRTNHAVKTDKALLIGYSGDGYNALNFALTYPTEVAAIALPIAAVNLKAYHDGALAEGSPLADEIHACYGGTLASFNAAEPTANPWNRLEYLEGIPIYCWWSDDDPGAKAEYMVDITERVTTAKGESIGSIGHWFGPHGLSHTADVIEFLERYRR